MDKKRETTVNGTLRLFTGLRALSSGCLVNDSSDRLTPEQVAEELAELIRDLHELLESYAPLWYTQDLDTRVCDTLAKFTLSKKTSQDTKPL
jgi:hypothetical protein